jgi:adenylate cyclase
MQRTATPSFWQRFENSGMPLALKWSLAISALICLGMGALGSYLIAQQRQSYQQQTEALGQTIASQLAHAASEPLMADDQFTLQLLLKEQTDLPLILQMRIEDTAGHTVAATGQPTPDPARTESFSAPIHYQDVRAGTAWVSLDRAPLERSLRATVLALATITLLFILVTILFAFPLARRFARPIHQLIAAEQALRSGKPPPELPERRDEIGMMVESFHRLASGLAEKQTLERVLSRHVSPDIARRLLDDPGSARLGGRSVEGSVLFCDIVGFTRLSEALGPEDTVALLNQYFGYFALAASGCQGTVDKFIGDCIMVVFGIDGNDPQHGLHAVTCALLMQAVAERINRQRRQRDREEVHFRIGLNSGSMLAGNLGSDERMEFTVVGDTVNLAARLCDEAPPGGVVLNETTRTQPGVAAEVLVCDTREVQIRNRNRPALVHRLSGLTPRHASRLRAILNELFPDDGAAA